MLFLGIFSSYLALDRLGMVLVTRIKHTKKLLKMLRNLMSTNINGHVSYCYTARETVYSILTTYRSLYILQ